MTTDELLLDPRYWRLVAWLAGGPHTSVTLHGR